MFVVSVPFTLTVELPADWMHRKAALEDLHAALAEWGATWGLSSTLVAPSGKQDGGRA